MGSGARGGITYTAAAASGAKYTIRTSMGDKPVNYVSWYDAARFTNWLGNGQGSGSTETGDISKPGANVANYAGGADWNAQDGNVTTVGSAAANNYFGTVDMAGNVFEWNDAVISDTQHVMRGGGYGYGLPDFNLRASSRGPPRTLELDGIGFRVASVTEPSALLLTMLASGVMLLRPKR